MRMQPSNSSRLWAWLIVAGLPWLVTGCLVAQPHVSVPVQANAAKQYGYAVTYREGKNLNLIADEKKLAKGREVVRLTFAKVAEYYPDDRIFTPLAKLEMIDMDAGLDTARVTVSTSQVNQAIKEFKALAKAYPEHEFIQAKTLYDQGMCYKRLGKFDKAQGCFLTVRDTYSKNKNREILAIAKSAAYYYNQTYVNE